MGIQNGERPSSLPISAATRPWTTSSSGPPTGMDSRNHRTSARTRPCETRTFSQGINCRRMLFMGPSGDLAFAGESGTGRILTP